MDRHHEEYLNLFNRIDFEKIKDHPNILIAANFWTTKDMRRPGHVTVLCALSTTWSITIKRTPAILSWWKDTIQPECSAVAWHHTAYNQRKFTLPGTYGYDHPFHIPHWPLEALPNRWTMIFTMMVSQACINSWIMQAGHRCSCFYICSFMWSKGRWRTIPSSPFWCKRCCNTCAVFSYLVHIFVIFRRTSLINLSYFADDVLEKNGLHRKDLRKIAEIVISAGIPEGYPDTMTWLINTVKRPAIWYKSSGLSRAAVSIKPGSHFSPILMVFERIDPESGALPWRTQSDHRRNARRVLETVKNFQTSRSNCVKI